MRVAFVVENENSPIYKVFRGYADFLNSATPDTYDLIMPTPKNKPLLDDYDVVHFGWLGLLTECGAEKTSLSVWSVWTSVGRKRELMDKLNMFAPDLIVTDDTATLQSLGRENITNVARVPMALDFSQTVLPPSGNAVYTAGVFGNNYPSKRFTVPIFACKDNPEFDCYALVMPERRTSFFLDPQKHLYEKIDVLVHSSFNDTNSMPVMEALSYGVPVITTESEGTLRVVEDGKNGLFYNGSIDHLRRKLKQAKELWPEGRVNHQTKFPSVAESAAKLALSFEELFDD